MKSRVRENRTHGSVRGSRQAFHLNTMKGESRLSTRHSKMKVKQVAEKMLDKNSKERKIAEKMFDIKFEEMTPEQRVLAAECISAFNIQLMEE